MAITNSEIAEISDFDHEIINLRTAIQKRDKKGILKIYEEINLMNFDNIPTGRLNEYDELVDSGNDILYS